MYICCAVLGWSIQDQVRIQLIGDFSVLQQFLDIDILIICLSDNIRELYAIK